MKHYLNVCDIDGAKVQPVDIITFGSPCQDLSVAGKRAGLKHETNGDEETTRSGLFMEAVRIIKEMRDKTNGVYPAFALWENVPGAFSSNRGHDFRTVIEELCRIKDKTISIPMPEKGKWHHAGYVAGDGWSLAWRVMDAQYFGVPQRRKRIFLVADFNGGGAGEILFEPEGMQGSSAEGIRAREGATGSATDCAGTASLWRNEPVVLASAGFCYEPSGKSRGVGYEEEKSPTLRAGVVPAVVGLDYNPKGGRIKLSEGGGKGALIQDNKSATLSCNNDQVIIIPPSFGIGWNAFNCGAKSTFAPVIEEEIQPTLTAKGAGAVCCKWRVRRLTPTECARLQGFSDEHGELPHKESLTDDEYKFWLDVRNTHAAINGKTVKEYTKDQMLKWYNKLHSDAAEYKMWGNGIALPCARVPLSGMARRGAKTLGSLFDGSGGFPLAGLLEGIQPIWASEIEPYPIAVTCNRFGNELENKEEQE